MNEVDTYDSKGQETDDINSVVEYIRVALGYDHTADDEDDDSGQNLHLAKAFDYFFHHTPIAIEQSEFTEVYKEPFSEYRKSFIQSIAIEVVTPPPDAA